MLVCIILVKYLFNCFCFEKVLFLIIQLENMFWIETFCHIYIMNIFSVGCLFIFLKLS